jgi:hypothetical protein
VIDWDAVHRRAPTMNQGKFVLAQIIGVLCWLTPEFLCRNRKGINQPIYR